MGFEFLVASGDSLVQIAAANGEMAVVIYALRYFWRAGGGYAPAARRGSACQAIAVQEDYEDVN